MAGLLPLLMDCVMYKLRCCVAAASVLLALTAHASSLVGTSNVITRSLESVSNTTSKLSSSLRDSKIVHAAHNDAISFVVSEGEVRGAFLESALEYIRHEAPELLASTDMQLARAIITN